jgi:hypothetical protein
MSSAYNLMLDFKFRVDGVVDKFDHLSSRHYFVLKGADEENGLFDKDNPSQRRPVIFLQEANICEKGHQGTDHVFNVCECVLQDQS